MTKTDEPGKAEYYAALTPAIELVIRCSLDLARQEYELFRPSCEPSYAAETAKPGTWHPLPDFANALKLGLKRVFYGLDDLTASSNWRSLLRKHHTTWHELHRQQVRDAAFVRHREQGYDTTPEMQEERFLNQFSAGLNNAARFSTYANWSSNVEKSGIQPYQQTQLFMMVHLLHELETQQATGISGSPGDDLYPLAFNHNPSAIRFADPKVRTRHFEAFGRSDALGCPFHKARSADGSPLVKDFTEYVGRELDARILPLLHPHADKLHPEFIAGANSRIRAAIEAPYQRMS